MDRTPLHDLVDRIPESDIPTALRFLELLTANNPAFRAARSAAMDDEEVTYADEAAILRAKEDVSEGRVSTHEEVLREFALV